ncbi:MAG: hypothetical protein OHK0013_49980 [Sandaracinaceae bacterium]
MPRAVDPLPLPRYDRKVRSFDAPPIVHEALARFRATLVARFGARLRELVLFGSRARGVAHEESDLDVLVVIDDLTASERREIAELAYDAGQDGDELVSISPLMLSTEAAADMRSRSRRIMQEIARDGVPL